MRSPGTDARGSLLPAPLAGAAAVVPWLSLLGTAVTLPGAPSLPGSPDGEVLFSLREQFTSPGSAILALLAFLVIPGGLAVWAALRRPGPVWAVVAVLCGVLALLPPIALTSTRMMWGGANADGTPTGGSATAMPTVWILPLLLGGILLGAAALTTPPRDSGRSAQRPGHSTRWTRGVLAAAGIACAMALILPDRITVASWSRPRMGFAFARVFEDSTAGLLALTQWPLTLMLLLALAVLSPLRPRRAGAVVIAVLALPIAALNLVLVLYTLGTVLGFQDFHRIPGPALPALLLAPLLALLGAWLLWREARRPGLPRRSGIPGSAPASSVPST